MNKWTFIRVGLIVVGIVLTLWQGPTSSHASPQIDGKALIIALIFGVLGLQFVLGLQVLNKKSDEVWSLPSWKENPFSSKQPLQFFHLGGWFFVVSSFMSVVLTWSQKPEYILDSLMPFCFGAGIIGGVHFARFLFRKKFKAV